MFIFVLVFESILNHSLLPFAPSNLAYALLPLLPLKLVTSFSLIVVAFIHMRTHS